MSDQASLISGTCAGGFEAVRAAFVNNFTQHSEVGAAVAVWVDGDLVVNLWGGYAGNLRTPVWSTGPWKPRLDQREPKGGDPREHRPHWQGPAAPTTAGASAPRTKATGLTQVAIAPTSSRARTP